MTERPRPGIELGAQIGLTCENLDFNDAKTTWRDLRGYRSVLMTSTLRLPRRELVERHHSTRNAAAGSRPFGCRPTLHQPAAPISHRSELCPTHESLSRNTVNFTSASAAPLHHWYSRAASWGTSRRADRLGTAAMGRTTCANQRPRLGGGDLRAGRRVRQHKRSCRVDDDHPIDDSASSC